jgi:AmiR/NasT family two-component response regulator
MPDQGATASRPGDEHAEIVDRATALLMKRRRLSRSEALARLRDIAAEVGLKLHEAAALVLSLDEA